MKIDVICNDGSPMGVTELDIYGSNGRVGVGGAELGLLTLCKYWHDVGHDITLYNNPNVAGGSSFKQAPMASYRPNDDRDILITFRSPNPLTTISKGKKIWYSNDQRTIGDFKDFASKNDIIVCISPYHQEYLKHTYGISGTYSVDIPVRSWEYNVEIDKVKGQCLFSSVPDRGADVLATAWREIVAEVPEATLVITGDWGLWTGKDASAHVKAYRDLYVGLEGSVKYLSAISRYDLIRYQLQSEIQLHPSTYDELFCISVAEAQVAGAYPVTSTMGALATTNMGITIPGNPRERNWIDEFVKNVVTLLKSDGLSKISKDNQKRAKGRFSLKRIGDEWEKIFSL